MTARAQVVVAIAAALVEYLLVSLLFDARELVPPFFDGIGELAPIPILIGAAFLILRAGGATAAAVEAHGASSDMAAPVIGRARVGQARYARRQALAYGLHTLLFLAFLGVSLRLRAARELDAASGTLDLAWATLAALVALSLAVAVLAGGAAELARRLVGPALLGPAVGVAAWAAGQGTGELWTPLSRATLVPTAALARLFAPELFVDFEELVVGTEPFSIRIDPVCSGYEGMGLVGVLMGAFLWTHRSSLRWPRALWLWVGAVVAAFVANVLRVTALLGLGVAGAPDAAIRGFHSKAGWLLFCAIALVAVALGRRARFFRRLADDEPADTSKTDNPSAAYLTPLLAWVAASLVAGLASDEPVRRLEALGLVAAGAALLFHRRELGRAFRGEPVRAEARGALPLALAVGVAVAALWLLFHPDDAASSAPIEELLARGSAAEGALWVALRLVASVAVVPLIEEPAFRGFLMRRLVAADFSRVPYERVTPLAVLASSLVFAVLHEQFIAGALAGAAYGAVAMHTGRLRAAVLAHVTSNAVIAGAVLFGGRWSLWT